MSRPKEIDNTIDDVQIDAARGRSSAEQWARRRRCLAPIQVV
jgi:hypothetical protein